MRKWILSFTAVFLTLLAFNIVPALRGGWGWRWPYERPSDWQPVIVLGLLIAIYIGGAWWLRSRSIALVWAVVAGLFIALGVQNVRGNPFFMLFSHTVSPVQTGASTVAVQYFGEDGAQETLRNWPEVMRDAEAKTITHFTTSPPGQALVHHWLTELTGPLEPLSRPASMALRPYQCSTLGVMRYERGDVVSAGIGMLMPLWAALAVLPIYFLIRELIQDREAAVRAAQWWPLVPSLLLFAPTWSTFYPFLSATTIAFLVMGLKRRRLVYCFLSGIVMSVATFLNFAILPILGLSGLFTLMMAYFRKDRWHWPLLVGAWFAAGLSTVWLVFWHISGLTPLDILEVTFEQHLDIERNYFIWLLLHPYDMLMFAGWPLALLGLWGVWRAIRRLYLGEEGWQHVDVLAMSLAATVIILDVTGITRGESARIWLFFVPLVLAAGSTFFLHSSTWDIPLLIGQGISVVVMGAVLPVVTFDMNPPVEGPRIDVAQLEGAEFHPVNAVFESGEYEGRFRLIAYRFVADPARRSVAVEFVWEGEEQVERPYHFEVLAYAGNRHDGLIVVPHEWYSQRGHYLPTCWQPNERIHELEVIALPVISEPVVWKLELRAIDEYTGDMMLVAEGASDDTSTVTLGPIPYP